MRLRYLIGLFFLVLVLVSCSADKNNIEYIKGKSFISEKGNSIIELTFKRDMSIVYTWKNAWQKEKNYRTDLYYTLKNSTNFTILTANTDTIWGQGHYSPVPKPCVIVDNFPKDTLWKK